MIPIALADDHEMFVESLSQIINKFIGCRVIIKAKHGADLLAQLSATISLPVIAIVDLEMPVMNGIETIHYLHQRFPSIKKLVITENQRADLVTQTNNMGVMGCITKNDQPAIIEKAIQALLKDNCFYKGQLFDCSTTNGSKQKHNLDYNAREITLIKLCTTNMASKEIADRMGLTEKNFDKIKSQVFKKYKVNNRTALVTSALKTGLISLNDL